MICLSKVWMRDSDWAKSFPPVCALFLCNACNRFSRISPFQHLHVLALLSHTFKGLWDDLESSGPVCKFRLITQLVQCVFRIVVGLQRMYLFLQSPDLHKTFLCVVQLLLPLWAFESNTVAQWLALQPHRKKVVGLNPGLGFLCVVCTFLFFPQSRNMRVKLITDLKLQCKVVILLPTKSDVF